MQNYYRLVFKTLIISVLPIFLTAQNLTQTIRGKVTDTDTGQPLAGATVQLVETGAGAVSDALGNYRLEKIPVGRYRLRVSYLGYQTLVIPEILVESGREVIQNITLTESPSALDSVVVAAPRLNLNIRTNCPTSVHVLTIEEVLRFPATFYDPARLATTYAGVVNDNDQANGISIRGNAPNGLLWRLEGVDIVNPNHTANAGTFSDRVTANAGGVNILSAQMLGASTFYTGAFPVAYANALAGVLDMQLRSGNDQKRETIAQIGLLGLDLASEGPFSKKGKSSYLFNARYSTVGLLEQLGINFGDEKINFYDLSFNFNFPFKNGARLTVFGTGGNSENIFEAQRDSSAWEFQKDGFDIKFKSSMGALGTTFTQPVGKKAIWRTALAYSALDSKRTGDQLNAEYQPQRVEDDRYNQSKLSIHTVLNFKQNARMQWQFGVVATQQDFDIQSTDHQQTVASGKGGGIVLQPYTNWRYQLLPRVNLNAGLVFVHFTFNATSSLEPRASLSWDLSEKHSLSLAYGLHSQLQQPQLYFAEVDGGNANKDLGFTRAHHLVLDYREDLGKLGIFTTELFYQHLFDAPVSRDQKTSFSALNLLEGFVTETLVNKGTGTNYGVEFSLQKYLQEDFYFLINATWYQSKYEGSDGIERDTRWDGNYIFNATAGKEWRWSQRGGKIDAVFGANVRIAQIGGFRDTPIDTQASAAAGATVYKANEAFTIRLKDYFRTDLRVYYKRNKTKYNSTLALDIQNLTNAQNEAFSYYDTFQQRVVVKNQLGLIPLLSWRIEF